MTLHKDAMTYAWEEKAALVSEYVDENLTPAYSSDEILNSDSFINLSDYMSEDGRLKCDALPAGKWVCNAVWSDIHGS